MSQYLDPNQRGKGSLDRWADGFEIIPARSTVEAEPFYIIPTGGTTVIRTYIRVSGTVSTLALQIHYYVNGEWYDGPTTNNGDAIDGSASVVRDWYTERGTKVGFTVDSISGGGTVAVRAEAVEVD